MRVDNIPAHFPILNGNYKDFSVEWYRVVGTTIIFFQLFSIFSPHATNFMYWLWISYKRLRDRGCTFDKKRTKKAIQEEYNKVYHGPQFLLEYRYSLVKLKNCKL